MAHSQRVTLNDMAVLVAVKAHQLRRLVQLGKVPHELISGKYVVFEVSDIEIIRQALIDNGYGQHQQGRGAVCA